MRLLKTILSIPLFMWAIFLQRQETFLPICMFLQFVHCLGMHLHLFFFFKVLFAVSIMSRRMVEFGKSQKNLICFFFFFKDFLCSINCQVTQPVLHRHFHVLGAGVIEEVRVQRDKGFGFVRFSTHAEAAVAIQMGNAQSLLCGKQIKVCLIVLFSFTIQVKRVCSSYND